MSSRERAIENGTARGHALTATVLEELRNARLDRGLGGGDVARAVGLSPAQYSRIERGRAESLSKEQASRLLAAVGLELSVRTYPRSEPIRDAAHAALLGRFRARLHGALRFRTEVPFPSPGDRRAWDAVVQGPGWRLGVEAETRPRDRQGLERRLALKLRDGDVTNIVLLLLDSRHNRDFMRAHGDIFEERFSVTGPAALKQLGAGLEPAGNSIVML